MAGIIRTCSLRSQNLLIIHFAHNYKKRMMEMITFYPGNTKSFNHSFTPGNRKNISKNNS